ncbi:MAG: CDP-glycerol glycerophosphotransferase family protein [Propionibacteriaceae bacterium]|nr:CDP-glycerol glycerophosphotransferase family protein [Propionibacteriaceae bacterium]
MTASHSTNATRSTRKKSLPALVKVRAERLLLRIGVSAANLAYSGFKRLPVQHKVAFITWNSDTVTPDFQVLIDRLRLVDDPPTVVALCRELGGGWTAHVQYGFHLLHQMYEMATSKVVVLDAYCPLASILNHRPDLRVVQIWHALGAFKKFGWSIVDKSEGWSAQSNIPSRTLSRLLRMHTGYTDAVVSYSGAIPHFAEAFHCDPSIIHVGWLPRVELLRDDTRMAALRARIFAAHPELVGKRIALYAPTIRRTAMDASRVVSLVSTIHDNDWNLIVKPHPVRGERPEPLFPTQSVEVPEFSAIQLLAVADAVVTDYSAIVYEAYLRGIPVYFYVHDMEDYEQARGFYTHPREFPSRVYATAGDLIRDMNALVGDRQAMKDFVEIFLEDSPARVDILDLINPSSGLGRG